MINFTIHVVNRANRFRALQSILLPKRELFFCCKPNEIHSDKWHHYIKTSAKEEQAARQISDRFRCSTDSCAWRKLRVIWVSGYQVIPDTICKSAVIQSQMIWNQPEVAIGCSSAL